MKDATGLGWARIPTYAETIDALASGFGLIEANEQKLTFQRSWHGRQSRFGPNATKPWRSANQGRIGELLMLLSGDDQNIADELSEFLDTAETLLSFIRSRAVFTRTSYRTGLGAFLSIIAFPQLALFLCHIRARLPESTPLYYLFDLLPDIHMTEYDCAKNTRNAVRQQLDKITEANTADFRSSLNKITTKSDIKLKTIEDKIGKLNQNFSSRDCKEELPDKVKNVRAAYIAGTAIQRFIGHLSNGTPDIHSASLLGILKYYINEFTNQAQKKTQDNFHQSHIILHHDMIGSSNCFPEPDLDTSIMEILAAAKTECNT